MKLAGKVRDVRTIKQLLTRAETFAQQEAAAQPGAEHLVLSALDLPDGTARRAFERVGADPDGFAAAVAGRHAAALRAIGIDAPDDAALEPAGTTPHPHGVHRGDASAREAFQAASALAKLDGRLAGAHVIAAVADMQHGTAARAIAAMGIDRTALAAAARAEAAS